MKGSSTVLRCIGLAATGAGLLLYTSYDSRPILGRWSYTFAAVLVVYALGALAVCALSFRAGRRDPRHATDPTAVFLIDAGIAAWGAAYLVDALVDSRQGARLLEGEVLGAISPLAVVVEWLALVGLFLGLAVWIGPRIAPGLRNAALVLATLGLLLVAGEGLVRGLAIVRPQIQGFPTYSTRLWANRHVSLNTLGYRGPEPDASPGRRVAVIGDSFAFGMGVERQENRIGPVLADLLETRSGEPWESLDISRPDTHTLEHIEMLPVVDSLGADLIVLVYTFNDIDYLRALVERTVLTERPRTILHRVHPARLAFRNSYLFQQLYLEMRAVRRRFSPPARHQAYADGDVLARHITDVARFVERAREIAPTVCVIPFEVGLDAVDEARDRYDRFVRAAEGAGVPVCGIEGAFEGWPLDELVSSRHDAHPNARAHGLAAAVAVEPLLRQLAPGASGG